MKFKNTFIAMLAVVLFAGSMGAGSYFLFFHDKETVVSRNTAPSSSDNSFGWKFPIAKFPLTGSSPSQLAYSDIRDPGVSHRAFPCV